MNNKSTIDYDYPQRREPRTLSGDIRRFIDKHPTTSKVIGVVAASAVAWNVTPKILDALDTQNTDPGYYTDNHNPDTTQLILYDGANVRHDPVVRKGEQTNLIETLDLGDDEKLTIDSMGGIYIKENTADGDWYGIPATDLPIVDGSTDKDGLLWINDDRAYAVNPPIDD